VPSSRLGQDRFTSIAATPVRAMTAATRPNSSAVFPTTDPQTGTPAPARRGPTSSTQAAMPGFWMPMPFSIPEPTGKRRGGSRPGQGSSLTDLATAAP
jgi:hypothetical protein